MGVGWDAYRHPFHDLEAEAFKSIDLLRVVREQPDLAHPEVVQDLAADPVVALVSRVPERFVRLDRVEPLVLEVVRVRSTSVRCSVRSWWRM